MNKDYNYYKTIADICNERNDIYKKFKVEKITPYKKFNVNVEPEEGESFILESGENKYLMVETSTSFNWVHTRSYYYEINPLDINVAKYLHDYDQEDHKNERHKLFVFSYIDGEPLKTYLNKIDEQKAYKLGTQLAETLKKVHALEINVLIHHVSNWNYRYKWVQKSIIENYVPNGITDNAYNYFNENKYIIEKRYSSAEYYHKIDGDYVKDEFGNSVKEKTLSFIFNDIKIDNLVVSNDEVYINCPINVTIAEPFYDFKYLSLIALENKFFARGLIDGYCKGKFINEFFEMLKYYTSELIINSNLDEDTIIQILDSYDNYNLDIPKWYEK